MLASHSVGVCLPSSVVFACLAIATTARAQFGPQNVVVASGAAVVRVHAADLDADGDQDLLACFQGPPGLVWYPNLGGGSFGPAVTFLGGPYAGIDVKTVDWDGDGILDVVAAVDNYTPQLGTDVRISLARGLGGGTFGALSSLAFVGFTTSISLADADADGDLDLFYADWTHGSVRVILDTGTSSFDQLATDQALGPRDMHAADLDGDGLADLLIASYGLNQVSWHRNLGGGQFAPPVLLNAQADGANAVDAADLDGDGDLDPLSASASGNDDEAHRYVNLGGGSFGQPVLIENVGFPGSDIRGADLDLDGDQDVLVAEFYGASWYPNPGNGSLGARQVITTSNVGVRSAIAADLSGDGYPDLVVACGAGSERLAWYENRIVRSIGTNYCGPAVPNSAGLSGTISAIGSDVVSADHLRLLATNLPPNRAGIFLASRNQGSVPNPGGSFGVLCLDATIHRIGPALNSGATGSYEKRLALTGQQTIPVADGQTWNFQAWFRDQGASNMTDGVSVVFAP